MDEYEIQAFEKELAVEALLNRTRSQPVWRRILQLQIDIDYLREHSRTYRTPLHQLDPVHWYIQNEVSRRSA